MNIQSKILITASLCLTVGVCVAYYNTSSLGYDNANIISFDNEQVNILDFTVKYADAKEKIDKIKENTPDKFMTI